MSDITIIYISANVISDRFAKSIQSHLYHTASGGAPIISVTHKPIDFGHNICVGVVERSARNIYRQMLAGALYADTPYVGIAEDDVLYGKDHFTVYRPPMDTFAYNVHKWSLYTWTDPPMYSFHKRKNNTSLIAPRELLIEAIDERYNKWPDDDDYPVKYWGEVGRFDAKLGVTVRKTVEFWSHYPNVVFSHEDALGFGYLGTRKRHGYLRAYDVYPWGKARDVVRIWEKNG
jgi:hypothetical protein